VCAKKGDVEAAGKVRLVSGGGLRAAVVGAFQWKEHYGGRCCVNGAGGRAAYVGAVQAVRGGAA
jgi:hypothetical protein